jgi:hypothetical protein
VAIKKDTLDELLLGRDPKAVFSKDGLFDELKKALAERMLNAELDDHLDNEAADGSRNRRNGSSKKTVLTETAKIDVRIPRDREGGASAGWRGVRGVAAPGCQASMKRPDAGADRVVSDPVRRTVRFGLSISCKVRAPSGRLIGLSANNCAFESSSVVERRRFEIVNPAALNAPTQELAVMGFRPDSDGIARMGVT